MTISKMSYDTSSKISNISRGRNDNVYNEDGKFDHGYATALEGTRCSSMLSYMKQVTVMHFKYIIRYEMAKGIHV